MKKTYAKGGGRFATNITRRMGTRAEQHFEYILMSNNLVFRPAKTNEEHKFHYDYVVANFLNCKLCKIEVKATKAPRRGQAPDSSILYLEIKSVGGYPGWIYGSADYIAFQIDEKFILFCRYDLVEYVENTQDKMPIIKKSGIVGTRYGRKGRRDLVAIYDMKLIMDSLKYIELSANDYNNVLEHMHIKVNFTNSKKTLYDYDNRTYAQVVCSTI
jgi:hypothetical protein